MLLGSGALHAQRPRGLGGYKLCVHVWHMQFRRATCLALLVLCNLAVPQAAEAQVRSDMRFGDAQYSKASETNRASAKSRFLRTTVEKLVKKYKSMPDKYYNDDTFSGPQQLAATGWELRASQTLGNDGRLR